MAKKVEREPSRREIKKVIAATTNHYNGKAAMNAIDLKRLLGIKNNPVPDELRKAYPQLETARLSSETRATNFDYLHLRMMPASSREQSSL
jgi:hypothetical protein